MFSASSFTGIIIGLGSFLIIGLLHPVVIKGEYHFGTKIWPMFLIGGIICVVGSILIRNLIVSTFLGVLGFSLFWSIHELFEQKERVRKGWFPENPKRKNNN